MVFTSQVGYLYPLGNLFRQRSVRKLVQKARSMYRKITDYFSMFLLMPILIVVSGGLSIFMSTMLKQMDDFVLLAPIMKFMI